MQKQKIILIIGIVLAIVSVFLVKIYMDMQQQVIEKSKTEEFKQRLEKQVAVLVAKQDIPRGSVLEDAMVESKIFPTEYVQPNAATNVNRISGMIATAAISKGEQITTNKLEQAHGGGGRGLAEATPIGKRAISIAVDNISSLAGMIKPGDYVDVIAMLPVPQPTPDGKQAVQPAAFPLFQNVLVLAVGKQLSSSVMVGGGGGGRYSAPPPADSGGSPLITIALTSREASLVAFVQEQGKIRLMLRSPADSNIETIPPATWDSFLQYVFPRKIEEMQEEERRKAAAMESETEATPAPPQQTVEIYRGLKQEKVPISNQ